MRAKREKTLALILAIMPLMTNMVWACETQLVYEMRNMQSINCLIMEKVNPALLNKCQQLAGATSEDLPLIIWLSENSSATHISVNDLKVYAASLLRANHSANVYCVCEALPVIMATVRADEVSRIATYDFVEHIGDGGRQQAHLTLDISRNAIRCGRRFEEIARYNGSGINVTIIDTGIVAAHPDLDDLDDNPGTNDPKVTQELSFVDWNHDGQPDGNAFDNKGHGTCVAGIVAGTGAASGYQYVGVAPGAWLWNYKVFEVTQWVWDPVWQRNVMGVGVQSSDIVHAIDHAISQRTNVIVMCFGMDNTMGGNGDDDVSRAADRAVSSGITVVASAGNDGPDAQTISAPGSASRAITVGSIDDHNTQGIVDDVIDVDSSRGPTGDGRTKPDVMAPGSNIITTMDAGSWDWQTFPEWHVGNSYVTRSGTSFSAPHVAGVAALILQAHPCWTPEMVKNAIKSTATLNDNLQTLGENDRGKGIVDAYKAITCSIDEPANMPEHGNIGGVGDHHEEWYENGTIKVNAYGVIPVDVESISIANSTKDFNLTRIIQKPTFTFGFHEIGSFVGMPGGYTGLNATIRLFNSSDYILFKYEETIHSAGWTSYDVDSLDEIS